MNRLNPFMLLFVSAMFIFLGTTFQAQACGSATICNNAGCNAVVTVTTNFGNVYSQLIPDGSCHTFFFAAAAECAAVITVNGVNVAQPQAAVCASLINGSALCPRRLCVTGPNSWVLL